MVSVAVDRWIRTAELFDERYGAIGVAQWVDPTPCSEWDVAALVDHVSGTQVRFGSLLGLAESPTDWPAVYRGMTSLLAEPTTVVGTVTVPGLGNLSKSQVLEICTNDLLIHTWDLSRATGAEEALPLDLVEACFEWLQSLPAQVARSPGRYTEAVTVDADADIQTRMLAFAGRAPRNR